MSSNGSSSRACKKVGLTEILGWQPYYDAKTFAELMAILREGDVDLPKLEGTPAGECLDRYCNRLAETRYFDFTAIMSEAVALLEEDQGFRDRVRDQVRYLTVDEYQDVNPLQERLVLQLADLGAKVTVVGDDDQLLYGWRGSSISNILTFADRHPKVVIDRLEANFRSSRGVVDLAREVIAHNDPDRLTKKMVSAGNQAYEEGDIEMPDSFGDPDEEASYIAARIGGLVGTPFRDQPDAEERGLAFNDVAILVRVKRLIPAIVDTLEAHQIPYVVAGVSSLFDANEAQAARELFYFLAGKSDESDPQSRLAASPSWSLRGRHQACRPPRRRGPCQHRRWLGSLRGLQPAAFVPAFSGGSRASRGEDRRGFTGAWTRAL